MQRESLDSDLCDNRNNNNSNSNKFIYPCYLLFQFPFWNLWNQVQMLRVQISLLDFNGFFAWFIFTDPEFDSTIF